MSLPSLVWMDTLSKVIIHMKRLKPTLSDKHSICPYRQGCLSVISSVTSGIWDGRLVLRTILSFQKIVNAGVWGEWITSRRRYLWFVRTNGRVILQYLTCVPRRPWKSFVSLQSHPFKIFAYLNNASAWYLRTVRRRKVWGRRGAIGYLSRIFILDDAVHYPPRVLLIRPSSWSYNEERSVASVLFERTQSSNDLRCRLRRSRPISRPVLLSDAIFRGVVMVHF